MEENKAISNGTNLAFSAICELCDKLQDILTQMRQCEYQNKAYLFNSSKDFFDQTSSELAKIADYYTEITHKSNGEIKPQDIDFLKKAFNNIKYNALAVSQTIKDFVANN